MRTTALALGAILLVAACGGAPATPAPTPAPTPAETPATTPAPTPAETPATTPAGTPVAGSGMCVLSEAEMSEIMGTQMIQQPLGEDGSCTYAASGMGIPSVVLRMDAGDLSGARMLFGDSAQDVTVAGQQGLVGNFMGIIVYVLRGSQSFVVQSVLTDDTPEVRQQVIQVAEMAYPRLP
jgi:hypothetical protein